jgi:hypothetical protein
MTIFPDTTQRPIRVRIVIRLSPICLPAIPIRHLAGFVIALAPRIARK